MPVLITIATVNALFRSGSEQTSFLDPDALRERCNNQIEDTETRARDATRRTAAATGTAIPGGGGGECRCLYRRIGEMGIVSERAHRAVAALGQCAAADSSGHYPCTPVDARAADNRAMEPGIWVNSRLPCNTGMLYLNANARRV